MLTIKVTKDDIKNGKIRCSWGCPIALALRRYFDNVNIGTLWMHFTDANGKDWTLDTPEKLVKWINNFDIGVSVKPITIKFKVKK